MVYIRDIFSAALALSVFVAASAQSQTSGAPTPGSTVSLLFINTTTTDLTAYVQRYEPTGQSTYLINCAKAASSCDIGDATISVVEGQTYDFHTANNNGGALTIHCSFSADDKTPVQCTRTVAGGSNGYEVDTSNPSSRQWTYLPVLITKNPMRNGYNVPDASVGVSAGTSAGASATTATAAVTNVSNQNAAPTASLSGTTQSVEGSNAADRLFGCKLSITTLAAVALALTQVFFLSA